MKKTLAMVLAMGMTIASLTACGGSKPAETTAAATEAQTEAASSAADTKAEATEPAGGKAEGPITVVSREDGSGTRGAFIELFGIEEKDANGDKVDLTTPTAAITNSTSVMMTSVAGDANAIGYISLGSLNNTVKALSIDGAEATAENVKSGTYKVARPFNIVTKDGVSDVAQDFIDYIMSSDGQKVVEENGCISVADNAGSYKASGKSGKIVIAGSSSVTPVMEKLAEAYKALNPDVAIEVNQSDSTTGVNMATEGTCDIGMVSRELKDSESGVKATVIAQDGIAVIVNPDASIDELTSDQVKGIYTGELTTWEDVIPSA